MILSQEQADAVYDAMCALNNVGGIIQARLTTSDGSALMVDEQEDGEIRITHRLRTIERYDNQAAFAQAYSLN